MRIAPLGSRDKRELGGRSNSSDDPVQSLDLLA
jgi:hypothetical protein